MGSVVVWSSWSVCEVVLVHYVDAVTVMHVCMLIESEGAMVTAMLVWGMEVWSW